MKVTADYAITIAKERYGLQLDYSEESLTQLDKLLEKIYWGFSSHSKDEGEGGLIFNTAIIWGSYLGEYMRLKWGGTWILKGTERRISITSIEFSPINLVFQKITSHPEYSVDNYVQESKKVIYTSVIHPKKTQVVSETAAQPTPTPVPERPARKPVHIDKRYVYIGAGVMGIIIIIVGCVGGYALVSSGGLPAFGLLAKMTNTSTSTPQPVILATDTPAPTSTSSATMTQLPTYTPKPTKTPRPSPTPTMTYTETPTPSPTETEYIPPTRTRTPKPTSTSVPIRPTNTPVTPTDTVAPTDTEAPPPPPPPPPKIVSCSVSPSTVQAGNLNGITFSVEFSAPGFGFSVGGFNPSFPGQQGCSAGAGGTVVSCGGNSGMLPFSTNVSVTLNTDLGDCSVGYSSTSQ